MPKVLVIGGGFAGLSAVRELRRHGIKLEVSLIDGKENSEFLPLLPDVIGRGVESKYLCYPIKDLSLKYDFYHINGQVLELFPDENKAAYSYGMLYYDYLLLAGGSETAFYSKENLKESAFRLDNVEDAEKIKAAVGAGEYSSYVVAGGGYTGIEIATNIRLLLKKTGNAGRVVVVEKAEKILGQLPEWMKKYAGRNLSKMGIEVITDASVEDFTGSTVTLSDSSVFKEAMLIWSAGVKTPEFVQKLNVAKGKQGRIMVDEHLRFAEGAFAAGDTAEFRTNKGPIRMAVQFSLAEGRLAARNIIRAIEGRPLLKYRPVDLGFILPMANNSSCGTVLGLDVTGPIATFLHYLMCLYRLTGMENKLALLNRK